jgi:methylenetetrahydrofolate reductase (NADPH)
MKLKELFQRQRAVVSFEIFPPKPTSPVEVIYDTIDALAPLRPDYISVTYGAGGSTTKTTVEIASIIKNKYNINSLAHLTCLHSSAGEIDQILTELSQRNIVNILALRGDKPAGPSGLHWRKDFQFASDLAEYINSNYRQGSNNAFCLGGACYPEGHPECPDLTHDVENLKRKVEAGVSFLISQLFFDNELFYRFRERTARAGIRVPIQAGIMPVTNRQQIERIVGMTRATFPRKLTRILDKFASNQEAVKDAGIAYATEQIMDLLANDIEGIHLYTMNRAQVAKDIMQNIASMLYTVNC